MPRKLLTSEERRDRRNARAREYYATHREEILRVQRFHRAKSGKPQRRKYKTDAERGEARRRSALAYYYAHREEILEKRRKPGIMIPHCGAWREFPVGTIDLVCPNCRRSLMGPGDVISLAPVGGM